MTAQENVLPLSSTCESSSAGRAQPCQGWGREFESRLSLKAVQIERLFVLIAVSFPIEGYLEIAVNPCLEKGGTDIQYFRGLADYPLLEEMSTERTQYVYGKGGIIAVIGREGEQYPVQDFMGSTTLLVDEFGTVCETFRYCPYGGFVDSNVSGFKYRFHGQEYDPETGLYNFKARFYDPEARVFFSRDPQLQYTSPYLYSSNDPVNLSDPNGELEPLTTTLLVAAAIGAVVGGGMGAYTAVKNNKHGWELVGYITGSALIGAAAGVASSFGSFAAFGAGALAVAATGSTAAGIVAGSLTGAVTGTAIGAASAAATYALNEASGIENTDSLGNSITKGAILGAVTGAFAGGYAGSVGGAAQSTASAFASLKEGFNPLSMSTAAKGLSFAGELPLWKKLGASLYQSPKLGKVVQWGNNAKFINDRIGMLAKKGVEYGLNSAMSKTSTNAGVETVPYRNAALNPAMSNSVGHQTRMLVYPGAYRSGNE